MIAISHLSEPAGSADFEARATDALDVLAASAGFLRGSLGRSTDDPAAWVLVTEWRDVGSYRRALGRYEVKLRTPFFAATLDLPAAFETLVEIVPGGAQITHDSDREPTS